jgi:hypothetical protein
LFSVDLTTDDLRDVHAAWRSTRIRVFATVAERPWSGALWREMRAGCAGIEDRDA